MANGLRAAPTGGLMSTTQPPIRLENFILKVDFCFPKFNNFRQVVTKVPHSTRDEMEAAVESAKNAFKTWSRTTPLARQQIMFRSVRTIEQD